MSQIRSSCSSAPTFEGGGVTQQDPLCHRVKQLHPWLHGLAFYHRNDTKAADNNNNSPSLSSSSTSSALSSAGVIRHIVLFFQNPWEDLYSRWDLGRCVLNIYEPLDRGSWLLECCPLCQQEWELQPQIHIMLHSRNHTHEGQRL